MLSELTDFVVGWPLNLVETERVVFVGCSETTTNYCPTLVDISFAIRRTGEGYTNHF